MPGGLKRNLRDEPVSRRRQCGCSSAAAATSARGTLPLECSAWSWPAAIYRAATVKRLASRLRHFVVGEASATASSPRAWACLLQRW